MDETQTAIAQLREELNRLKGHYESAARQRAYKDGKLYEAARLNGIAEGLRIANKLAVEKALQFLQK